MRESAAPEQHLTLFAGPSASGIPPAAFAGATLRPPVRRGDIDALVASGEPPGITIICDGVFHAVPAVSHGEICRAIDAGWQVWGVSSIGAIRAHEMRAEGMRGYGYVYSMFERLPDFTDDEMCLLHFPEAPYFPVSEALVNLRFALEQRGETLGIGAAAQALLLQRLGALWFGDRTEDRMRSVMVQAANIDAEAADALLAWLRQHRIKTLDLLSLLEARPWQAG